MQQARANMAGLNTAAVAMAGNMRRTGRELEVFATNPVNQLSESIRRGELSFGQMGQAMRQSGMIAKRQKGLMHSYRGAIQDAAGNAKVMMDVQGGMANATVTAMDRIRVMGGVLRGFAGHLVKVGKNIQWAGRQITVGLTVPLAFAAWTASKQAEEFDAEMTRLVKVYNFASEDIQKENAILQQDVMNLTRTVAENFGFVAQQTTEVAANFAQMGFTGQQLIGMTSEALRIARLGEIDLATATELVRTTMNVWGGDIEDLTNTLNRFNMIENQTGLSTAELAEGIPILASVTQRLGLSAEEAAASLAVMREGGIETKQAATALRTALVRLTDPTPEAREKLMGLGIDVEEVWANTEGNVLDVVRNISDTISEFSGDLETQRRIVSAFGDLAGLRQADRFMRLVEGLAGRAEEGTVAYRAFNAALSSNEEAMETAVEEMRRWQESAAGTAELLRAQLSVEVARFGRKILDVVNAARQIAVNVLRWFNNLSDRTQNLVLVVTGLVAALGPATMLLGLMANAFGQLLTVFSRLLPSMSILTTEQAAQQLAVKNNAFAMMGQARAADVLAAAHLRAATAVGTHTAAQAGLAAPVAGRAALNLGRQGFGAISAGATAMGEAGGAAALRNISFVLKLAKGTVILTAFAIAIQAVMDNWDMFVGMVSDAISGPLENMRGAVKEVSDSFRRLGAAFNDPAFNSIRESLRVINEWVAKLSATVVAGIATTAIQAVTGFLNIINATVTSVQALTEALAALLTWDWDRLEDAGKSFGRSILDAVSGAGRFLGPMGSAAADMADSLKESSIFAAEVSYSAKVADKTTENLNAAWKDLSARMEVGKQVHEELVADSRISRDYSLHELENTEGITAEQRTQLRLLIIGNNLRNRMIMLEEERKRIMAAPGGAIINGNRLVELDKQRRDLEFRMRNIHKDITNEIALQEEANQQALEAEQERAQTVGNILSAMRGAISDRMSQVADSVMRVFERQKDAVLDGFDEQVDALKDRFDQQREEIEATYDAEIEAIEKVQDEEEELERLREQAFQREKQRLDFLSGQATSNIELRAALASGDLSQAAILRVRLRSQEEQFYMDRLEQEQEATKAARQEELNARKDQLEGEKDAQLEQLDAEEEARIEQIEQARDAAEEQFEIREYWLKQELDAWKENLATSEGEYQSSLNTLYGMLEDNQISSKAVIAEYSKMNRENIGAGFRGAMEDAKNELANEEKWKALGTTIAEGFGSGFGGTLMEMFDDIRKYLETGEMPPALADKLAAAGFNNEWADPTNPEIGGLVRHGGGPVPFMGGAPGLKKDEVPSVLQSGEYVIQRDAVKNLGRGTLDMLNNFHTGGLVGIGAAAATNFVGSLLTSMKDSMSNMFGMGAAVGDTPMSRIAGSTFLRGGKWPAKQWGVLSSNTRAAQGFIQNSWGDIIKSAFAGLERGDPKSDHSWGKAIDVMVSRPGTYASGDEIKTGWQIANWFTENADKFGTKYVIWQKGINSGTGWREYNRYGDKPGPTLGHYDHVHLSFLHDGGLVPQLAKGAHVNYDNTLANLHKGETVLTSNLSESLQRGIRNMESGGGSTYHVTIEVNGANMDEKQLAKKVRFELDKMDRAKGGRRQL